MPRPHSILELGCGAGDHFPIYPQDALIIALDLDPVALWWAVQESSCVHILQAHITRLPLCARFDWIVARHPDVDRHHADWERAFTTSRDWLNEGGVLLITLYSLLEVDTVSGWMARATLVPFALNERQIVAPGLAGRDRFVLAYR
ncbi:MAG: class I SAM-dependent methyltransferase [Anaerolineae bacterium]|nr:class I SAM-dependent methyltransferase [Anaerolineae bacterium]